MARLEDIPLGEREMMMELDCSGFEDRNPWVTPSLLSQSRVAIVSTAGLNLRSDEIFRRRDTEYRVIPDDTDPADVVMSHASVNFDRTGFQQDLNVCFPLERLHELAAEGFIGSVASFHYTVIGSTPPLALEPSARRIARLLKDDSVDTVLLIPV